MIFSNSHGSLLFPSLQLLPVSILYEQYHLTENKLYFNENVIFTLPSGLDCFLINEQYIVLISKDLIHIYYNTSHPKLMNTYKTSNPRILAINKDYLACCGYLTGQIYLIHLETNQIHMIQAHSHDIGYITLSNRYLASASLQGTVIRIFDLETREVCQEFRRGIEKATILCMNFSDDDKLLCVISDKYTIHVFVVIESNYTGLNPALESVDFSMQSVSVEEDDDMVSVEFSNSSQYSNSTPSSSYLQKSNRRKVKGLSRLLSTIDYDYSDYSIKLPKSLILKLESNKSKSGYVQPDCGGLKTRLFCEFISKYSQSKLYVYTFMGDVLIYGFKTNSMYEFDSDSSNNSSNSIIEEVIDVKEDYGKNMIRINWHIAKLPDINMNKNLIEKELQEFTYSPSTVQEHKEEESDDDFVLT